MENIDVIDQMVMEEVLAEEAFMLNDCENSVIVDDIIELIDDEETKLNAELFMQHHKISA